MFSLDMACSKLVHTTHESMSKRDLRACLLDNKRKRNYSGTEGATGKHGNAGTETTKRSGEREPVSPPYSRQESQMSLN